MADFRDDETFPPPAPFIAQEPRGYALSGKIMLSAIVILFAVVIIMVCLHIYARWYLLRSRRRHIRRARRRTHLVFYIEPSDPANMIPVSAMRGLDALVLKSLPTFTYKVKARADQHKEDKVESVDMEEGDEDEPVECAVCLSEFEDGERGRMLPKCNHSFHVECIDMWFHSHSTCPICRSAVELAELTPSRSQLGHVPESADGPGPTDTESVSVGGRRKGLEFGGVTIEVPRRSWSFSFTNSDESGPSRSPGFRSPTSRILSLKRILSRDKRSSPVPSPSAAGTSWCGGGESAAELDVELGLVEAASQSQSQTPR